MSWSVYAQGSKKHVKREVEKLNLTVGSYPPEELEQVKLAKSLILLAVDAQHDHNAVKVQASGSMSVSTSPGPRTVQSTNLDIKVEPLHVAGMVPVVEAE